MPDGPASLDSIELLKDLRVAIINFAEESRVAMGEAESEINRTIGVIQQAEPHWKGVIRDLQEQLQHAKEQFRQKNLYKSPTGGRQSVVDEKRLVTALQRKLEEAEGKLRTVLRWKRAVESEAMQYRGLVQQINRIADYESPRAVALLDRMADALDKYLAVTAPTDETAAAERDVVESMKRATRDEEAEPEQPDHQPPGPEETEP